MATINFTDAGHRLNDRYDADLIYQHGYRAALLGGVPTACDHTGRFWLIDEANLTALAKTLSLGPATSLKQNDVRKRTTRETEHGEVFTTSFPITSRVRSGLIGELVGARHE
jgi:hypothetical protein